MNKFSFAIYSSNGFQETFTKAHKDLLPVDFILTEGTPPRMVNGIPMLPMDKFNVIKRKIKNFFGAQIDPSYPFEYFLSNNKVDLILAEFGTSAAGILSICKKHNCRLIPFFYGIDAFGNETIQKYKNEYIELFDYATIIFSQSLSIKKQLVNIGCREEKIIINSAPPSDVFYNEKADLTELNLISIGRFVEKKAPLLLIKSFDWIKREINDAKLTMVGDGPLLNQAKELVHELNLENCVSFAGRVNQKEQLELMKSAAIFLQHSVTASDGDSEGLPVAIMEALAMGIPVVSTYHSGIPEVVIKDENGYLVDEGDYIKMAEYCIMLLKNQALRIKMGKAAIASMKKYSMESHIDKIKTEIANIKIN